MKQAGEQRAGHTPGPWVQRWFDAAIKIITPDGLYIAQVYGSTKDTPPPVAQANARLISAAPDLLAELQAAHKLLQLALKHMGGERQSLFAAESERLGLGTDGATRFHERAAAIARATGAAL